MTELDRQDKLYLEAAQGWLELGNHIEADAELECIAPQFRAHPDVLEVRWSIYANAKRWEPCLDVSETIIKIAPGRVDGWARRSFALHAMKRTREAFDLLAPVADKFPTVWTIPYNLACYCAQLGRLNECEIWFKRAMAINTLKTRLAAIDDPDLKPFWDSMSSTFKKRID